VTFLPGYRTIIKGFSESYVKMFPGSAAARRFLIRFSMFLACPLSPLSLVFCRKMARFYDRVAFFLFYKKKVAKFFILGYKQCGE
jgi:hypothetical protein